MTNILFVCGGNTCRSAMAKAFAEHECAQRELDVVVDSAGTNVSEDRATRNAIQVAEENDCDLTHHRPKQVTADLVTWADHVFTMTEEQTNVVKGFDATTPVTELRIEDPYRGNLDLYRETWSQLEQRIGPRLAEPGKSA